MAEESALTPEDQELAALRLIVAGTSMSIGEEFFGLFVQNLAKAIDVHYAFVSEFVTPDRVRTLGYWFGDHLLHDVQFDLTGTPCHAVLQGNFSHHISGVWQKYPTDTVLVENHIEGYLGIPLKDADGQVLGHLAIFDERPMREETRRLYILNIFAMRATSELVRLRMERSLAASEKRYRDLYNEAPIAYVHEGVDSRFISANHAAMRILGITPEEIEGTYGSSFLPDAPEARRRFEEAFAAVGKGTDTSGVVLELKRKDNGQPIWIQWWSNPDPSGNSTRTMFIDITERVLMEQEKNRLSAQNIYLQEELKSVHNFEEIVGRSPALLDVIENVNRVAATDASVLITGETGTGKELFARAIHSAGKRRDKPLIKLNCAALPSSLVESELFGHEKGAFSGAINRRIGRFELAQGGTIFLDEIGEVPMDVQVKLLRVLQEREFERVGGSTPIKVDVRIIAATNRDLPKAVRDGAFREDLFYRLNVFPISLPPLRDRAGDVSLLVQFLVAKFCARVGRRIESIASLTMEMLNTYHWPGNIRELENVLERAIILSNGETLKIDPKVFSFAPLEESAPTPISSAAPANNSMESVERNHVISVLKQTGWVIDGPRGAAKILGLHPNTLRSRLKKLGIERSAHEPS